jgi:beta-galactosidase
MKDEWNALNPQRQPGPLADALGGRVEEYYALDGPVELAGTSGKADVWGEMLSTSSPETAVLLRYGAGNGWLEGKPAMISRSVGKGSITYLGTLPDAQVLSDVLAKAARGAGAIGQQMFVSLPNAVEACVRTGGQRRVLVLINHGNSEATVQLKGRYKNLLAAGSAVGGVSAVKLPAQGVAVLEQEGETQ